MLPPSQGANSYHVPANEHLLCFGCRPDLVLGALWSAKECVLPALEELNPVGESPFSPKHRQT